MRPLTTVAAAALLASTLALGGCAYDDYGYGGVNVGYGGGYYGDAYGYGGAPYGWYDDYYYPGSGYWLYDRGGRRHRWDDNHRRYWEHRRQEAGNHWRGPRTRPWRPGMGDGDHWQGQGRPRDPNVNAGKGHDWRDRERDGGRRGDLGNSGYRRLPEATPRSNAAAAPPPPPSASDEGRPANRGEGRRRGHRND